MTVFWAAVTSLGVAFLATPLAIRLAHRTAFFDHPVAYKAHGAATPYLGGVAVMAGFLVAAVLFGDATDGYFGLAAAAVGMWLLGTVDDRVSLPPELRVVVEALAAVLLWSQDLGWTCFDSDFLNLMLTTVWVVGLINAFNLMDNMDGATATVAAASVSTLGVWCALEDAEALAALCFGLGGACLGFLPFNLASPSRIFLGDGGSMPIGFLVAALAMALPTDETGVSAFLEVLPLVGLVALDTCLVIVSRLRRSVPLLTGGRDHVTHRLRTRLPSARAVAFCLGAVQVALGAIAIVAGTLGDVAIAATFAGGTLVGVVALIVLETPAWRPEGRATFD